VPIYMSSFDLVTTRMTGILVKTRLGTMSLRVIIRMQAETKESVRRNLLELKTMTMPEKGLGLGGGRCGVIGDLFRWELMSVFCPVRAMSILMTVMTLLVLRIRERERSKER